MRAELGPRAGAGPRVEDRCLPGTGSGFSAEPGAHPPARWTDGSGQSGCGREPAALPGLRGGSEGQRHRLSLARCGHLARSVSLGRAPVQWGFGVREAGTCIWWTSGHTWPRGQQGLSPAEVTAINGDSATAASFSSALDRRPSPRPSAHLGLLEPGTPPSPASQEHRPGVVAGQGRAGLGLLPGEVVAGGLAGRTSLASLLSGVDFFIGCSPNRPGPGFRAPVSPDCLPLGEEVRWVHRVSALRGLAACVCFVLCPGPQAGLGLKGSVAVIRPKPGTPKRRRPVLST